MNKSKLIDGLRDSKINVKMSVYAKGLENYPADQQGILRTSTEGIVLRASVEGSWTNCYSWRSSELKGFQVLN